MREREGRVWAKTMPSHGPWNFISLGVTPYLKRCKTTVTSKFVITSIYMYKCTLYYAQLLFLLGESCRACGGRYIPASNTKECRIINGTAYKLTLLSRSRLTPFNSNTTSFLLPELRIKACYVRPSKYAKTKEELDSKLTCCSPPS